MTNSEETEQLYLGLAHIITELSHFNILLEHYEADFNSLGFKPALTPSLQRKRMQELLEYTAEITKPIMDKHPSSSISVKE